MSHPWYITLFAQDYLDYYTDELTPELTSQEVDFILDKLSIPPDAHILDLCCGHGRHTIELNQRGYSAIGLDLSQPSLKQAREKTACLGREILWVNSDMRTIPFEAEFDAVVNWFTAFGYLENDGEDQQVLEAVWNALRPGGKFLIDTVNHEWLMRNFTPHGWTTAKDGSFVLEDRKFDLLNGRNEVEIIILKPDGDIHITRHSVRSYTLVEMRKKLALAGFQIQRIWGDIYETPYSIDAQRMIILSEKPNNKGAR